MKREDNIKIIKTPVGDKPRSNNVRMSVGHLGSVSNPEVKTSGIKMRGAGAAKSGTKCRGPMA